MKIKLALFWLIVFAAASAIACGGDDKGEGEKKGEEDAGKDAGEDGGSDDDDDDVKGDWPYKLNWSSEEELGLAFSVQKEKGKSYLFAVGIEIAIAEESGAIQWLKTNETEKPVFEKKGEDGYLAIWRMKDESEITLEIADRGGHAHLKPSFKPRSNASVAAVYITLEEGEGKGYSALADAGEEAAFLHNGYQSWTFTGVVPLTSREPIERDNDGFIKTGGDNREMVEEVKNVSWWHGAIKFLNGLTILGGALEAELFKTHFSAGKSEAVGGKFQFVLAQGGTGESVTIKGGENREFELFYLGFHEDEDALINDYAAGFVETSGAWNFKQEKPLKGWATWNYFFEDIDEEVVQTQIDALKSGGYLELGFDTVQIDDGYQPQWGDWSAEPSKFPKGLPALAETIASNGFRPGLWLAPFLAESDSPIALENPDWLLKDKNGETLRYSNVGDPRKFVFLDITRPEVEEWLRKTISSVVEMGFTFLKLDYLWGAAFEADYFEKGVTSMQSYRRGMRIIREAAGEKAHMLACGAPMLPSVGYFDSFRVGPDIVYGTSKNPAFNLIAGETRHVAARYFVGRRWFYPDPDQLLIRRPLPDNEAALAAIANLVTGGMFQIGDDMTGLEEARHSILKSEAFNYIGELYTPFTPYNLFGYPTRRVLGNPVMDVKGDSRQPEIWSLKQGDTTFVAIFNWEKEAAEIKVPIADLNLAGKKGKKFFGEGELKEAQGEFKAALEGRSAMIAEFKP